MINVMLCYAQWLFDNFQRVLPRNFMSMIQIKSSKFAIMVLATPFFFLEKLLVSSLIAAQ